MVPLILEHLGDRSFHLSPAHWTYATFLRWFGIHEFMRLVDEHGHDLSLTQCIRPWGTLVVQLSPEDLAFELSMRLTGLGPARLSEHHGLHVTTSLLCNGLWHIDQALRNELLLTWASLRFPFMVVWLPSFAMAVVEKWPGVMDDSLRAWLEPVNTQIYALVWESWGWNLVKFNLDAHSLRVTFFESEHAVSSAVSFLAYRVKDHAKRTWYQEAFQPTDDEIQHGSLSALLAALDQDLGLPAFVIAAFQHVRSRRLQQRDCGDPDQSLTPTLAYDGFQPSQLPLAQFLAEQTAKTHGLTARFILDFANALTCLVGSSSTVGQIKVLCLDCTMDLMPFCEVQELQSASEPLWIFVLVKRHWTLVHISLRATTLHVVQYDGMSLTSLSDLAPLTVRFKSDWQAQHVNVSSTWIFPQSRPDSCGTIALAHFAHLTGVASFEQAMTFESLHDSLAVCSSLDFFRGPTGLGPDETAIIQTLEQILPAKGVPEPEVKSRALAAIKMFGLSAIQKALQAKNVWAALKTLGNSRPKPFLWVQHHELQNHIKDRATSKFGAVDIKKPKKQGKPLVAVSRQLDPSSLTLPVGLFTTNCGTALPQLQLEEVQKDARGVAFASASDAQNFLADAKMISAEGLALLVVGPLPEHLPMSLPMHAMRVPAIYKGTNEPVLIDCTSIQLGDQAVYRRQNQDAPELQVCPTKVLRAHVYRDLWILEEPWEVLTAHPVRQLVQRFPIFRLCKDRDCDQTCNLFHPSLEEEGVESGLLDLWAFRWHGHDGTCGFFFEPRNADTPGPDETYAIIWLPQSSLSDVVHKVRTVDHCIAVCRLGLKYGVRVLSKHQEEVHQQLCPQKPLVVCAVKAVYRLEPLPAGTQRASLVSTLKNFGWLAKPLQPCKGSQGQAWQVGSDREPPLPYFEAQHGWFTITKVKDATQPTKPQGLIATSRTKMHIQEASASSGSAASDPWVQGVDPWSGYQKTTKAPAVPSQHVQSRFEDVEQRLQDSVKATVSQAVQHLPLNDAADQRMTAVESQIQSLVENQTKMEHWITDGSSKIHAVQQECVQLHHTAQTQGALLQQVVGEVNQCNASVQHIAKEVSGLKEGLTQHLDQYFDKQQATMEAILAKKQRQN
eukprot:s1936_g8.t1